MVRYSFWAQALIFSFVVIFILSLAALISLLGF
jgi:hypothetical protein